MTGGEIAAVSNALAQQVVEETHDTAHCRGVIIYRLHVEFIKPRCAKMQLVKLIEVSVKVHLDAGWGTAIRSGGREIRRRSREHSHISWDRAVVRVDKPAPELLLLD